MVVEVDVTIVGNRENTFGFAQDSVKQGNRSFEKILVPILKSHSMFQTGKIKISAEKTAHVLASSVRGFKSAAKDAAGLRALIKDLLVLVLGD